MKCLKKIAGGCGEKGDCTYSGFGIEVPGVCCYAVYIRFKYV